MIFAVAYLSFDKKRLQHKILHKHILNIGIYLCHGIYILFHSFSAYANLASTPLIKAGELSCPNFFANSTASLIATPVGISSSYFIS